MAWALERPRNPSVLRLHTTLELTARTIEVCPPTIPPAPLDRLVGLDGVRGLDLHRYRARINLRPGADPGSIASAVRYALGSAWGPPVALAEGEPELPRAFVTGGERSRPRERLVAESLEMAGTDPTARALFAVDGVAEVIVGEELTLVRLGRLFDWGDVEPAVLRALA